MPWTTFLALTLAACSSSEWFGQVFGSLLCVLTRVMGLQRRRELLLQKQEDLRQLRLKRQKRLKKDFSPTFKTSAKRDSEALVASSDDGMPDGANEWALTGDNR